MSLEIPAAPPKAAGPTLDELMAASAARQYGALDAIRAARQIAQEYTPFDLELSRLERNDFGNAKRLERRFPDKLLWLKDIGWHGWTGKHWSMEHGDVLAEKLADETHTAIYAEVRAVVEAGAWPGEDPGAFDKRVGALHSWARESGNSHKTTALLNKLRTNLTKTMGEMDRGVYLFNCENCTIDLSNHEKIKKGRHKPEHLITRISPVKFDPLATCPQFDNFLARILPDEAVQIFLQQWAGLSLTADISPQSLVLMYGTGANGKSTLEDVLRFILGDYAKVVAFTSLQRDDKRRGSEASPDLARLRGARAAFASEPENSVKFSEGLIKQMTGGDPITARYLNKEFFEYTPQFKLWLAFNHKPTVRGTDTGIWRRLKLVPFTVTIPPEERDPRLAEKLRAEASGILNWMIDGYRHWRDRGLIVPAAVAAATQEYRDESDPVGQFIADVVKPSPGVKVLAAAMFDAFRRWCKANAVYDGMGQTLFGRQAGERLRKERVGGRVYYFDVSLDTKLSGVDGDGDGRPAPPDSDDVVF